MPIPNVADFIHAPLTDLTNALKASNINNPPENTQPHSALPRLKELFQPSMSQITKEQTLQPRVPTIVQPSIPQPRVKSSSLTSSSSSAKHPNTLKVPQISDNERQRLIFISNEPNKKY